MKKMTALLLCICLCLTLMTACRNNAPALEQTQEEQSGQIKPAPGVAAPDSPSIAEKETDNGVSVPETALKPIAAYSELKDAIEECRSYRGELRFDTTSAVAEEAVATEFETATASGAVSDDAKSYNGTEFSGTNTQVADIDEGDIVKTDGEYIYILSNNNFVIMKADGASTEQVYNTVIGESYEGDARGKISMDDCTYFSANKYPRELYICGDRAVVISDCWFYAEKISGDTYEFEDRNYTELDIYDISDKSQPVLVSQLGQDGYGTASRMADGKVYIVSSYYVYDWDGTDPVSYVPRLYVNGVGGIMETNDICILPGFNSTEYCVICVYDIAGAVCEDNMSILGGGDTVYMNAEKLYVARSVIDEIKSEPYSESVYEVVDYVNRATTQITSFDISSGGVGTAATCTIPGRLDGQFAMDEYKGYLRVVTTHDDYSYSIYTDKEMDFTNYKSTGSQRNNSLYVLDEWLSVVGSIENLAEDEQVYSVRFDGDIGYFCTYETVDPLFCVDLSVPASPKVLSALKIPGFSEYLHVWAENELFGFGNDTEVMGEGDDRWTVTNGLKLVMFDTSDKTDVTEKFSLALDCDWSEALYNHKAMFVQPELGLIGFPAGSEYYIYSYNAETGFSLAKCVEFGEWYYNSRALYIRDCLYVVGSDRITEFDLNTFDMLGETLITYG